MKNPIENKKIAIVGGGPGGLTLARLLQLQGADVTVYERDLNKDVRVQGATLDLHEESGLLALHEAKLTEAFKTNYRPGADLTRIVDKHGHIMLDEHGQDKQELRPEIDRGPLRKLLLESLQPETVVWDSFLVAMKPDGEGWRLEFQNGRSATADLVIAADGANSRVRPFLTAIKPFYVGITAVEGAVDDSARTAPRIHALLKGGKIFAMGNGRSLIVSSKGDGSLVFYVSCKTDEHWYRDGGIDFDDRTQVTAWFRQEFAGWDESWLELFEKAEPHFIPRPQYCMPLDQHWQSKSNLTLLGDAAHLMPPFAGEGVNMAMLDALELSRCLTDDKFSDTRAAIAAYEKQMLTRFTEIAGITLTQTASLHSPHAIDEMIEMLQGN